MEPEAFAAGLIRKDSRVVKADCAAAHVPRARLKCPTHEGKPLRVLLHILIALAGRDLVTELVVLAGQSLALLLESLDIAFLGLELLLQSANLTSRAGLRDTGRVLAAGLLVTLEQLDTVLETENIKDHDIGAVENKGQEEGETAEVHVALRVEFAGLHFHAVGTEVCGSGKFD